MNKKLEQALERDAILNKLIKIVDEECIIAYKRGYEVGYRSAIKEYNDDLIKKDKRK